MLIPEPSSATPIRQALARLLRTARTLAASLRRAVPPAAKARQAACRATRLARTTEFLAALARTLAGDRLFCHPVTFPRFPGRYPALTAALRAEIGLPPVPPRSDAQRAAGRLHYLRRVFATQSTSRIATRLARRLGLTPTSAAWPHALIAIAVPPAALARTLPPARRPGRKPRQPRPTPFPPIPKIPTLHIPARRRVPQRE